MTSIAKASRINSAIQVIQHMTDGMSVVEACQTVGIPRSSYYYIVKNNPEAIAEIQALIDTHNREQLWLIMLNKNEILQKLIDTALAENTKPRERLAIYKMLNEMMDDLREKFIAESRVEKRNVADLLKGPALSKGVSNFTAPGIPANWETEI